MKENGLVVLVACHAVLCSLPSWAGGAAGTYLEAERSTLLQPPPPMEKFEYVTEDGRRIVITSLGNLIRFESPAGFEQVGGGAEDPIDGYVIAYRDLSNGALRVVHNVYRSQSSTIEAGLGDFVPVSFQGPDPKTVFPSGKLVRAVVVVETRDGLLQLRTTYSWIGGIVRVESQLTSVGGPTLLLSFKRQIRFPVDVAGAYGILESEVDLLPVEDPDSILGSAVVIAAGLCCRRGCGPTLCPPQVPPLSELGVDTHAILFQAGPDLAASRALTPTYLTAADAKDPCERMNPGPCQGNPLPSLEQDSVVTAGWLGKTTLARDRSVRFLTRTTVY